MNDVTPADAAALTGLDLGYIAMETPEFARDPYPALEAARARHPWLARCEVGYLVHGYQAIKDLMLMDDKLRTSNDAVVDIMGAGETHWGQHINRQILARSGPDHTRLRNSVAMAFTPRNVNRYRALMRSVISDLLDEWAPKGKFDVAEFAAYFPITIATALVGAPRDSVKPVLTAMETLGLAFSLDASLLPKFEEAFDTIWDFVDRLVVERERNGGGEPDEVLNVLIAAKTAGQLDDVELRDMLTFLFNAGYDTSKNMITLLMYTMLDHPEDWARCAEDPIHCRRVVDEQFRFRNTASPYRTVAQDFAYQGVQMPKDTLLVFALPLSGRDPAAFEEADDFEPERARQNRHVGFGRGMHMCLGQHLAKAQIEEGIHMMAQRLTNPRLAGEIAWRPYPGVWGLRTLPIEFTPALRRAEREDAHTIDAAAEGAPQD